VGARLRARALACRPTQRRFGSALDLAEQALDLYRKIQDSHGTGKMFLQKAKILEDSNGLEGAIELLSGLKRRSIRSASRTFTPRPVSISPVVWSDSAAIKTRKAFSRRCDLGSETRRSRSTA
jgi:hypothetical protein